MEFGTVLFSNFHERSEKGMDFSMKFIDKILKKFEVSNKSKMGGTIDLSALNEEERKKKIAITKVLISLDYRIKSALIKLFKRINRNSVKKLQAPDEKSKTHTRDTSFIESLKSGRQGKIHQNNNAVETNRSITIAELTRRIKEGTLPYFPRDSKTLVPKEKFVLTPTLDEKIQEKLVAVQAQDSSSPLNSNNTCRLNNEAYEAFKELKELVSKKYGITIVIDEAYRTIKDQKDIFERMHRKPENINKTYNEMCRLVASPGASEHNSGLAIDLALIDKDGILIDQNLDLYKHESDFMKIASELEKFGFILRYPKDQQSQEITTYGWEPWHITYVGRDVAQDMSKNNCITLEEYLQPEIYGERDVNSQKIENWRYISDRVQNGMNTGAYFNKILDYEQVEARLAEICTRANGMIKQQPDLAVTKYGFPIRYYTIGNGRKEIVITGATHGAEIVTTDFILELMQEMTKDNGSFSGISLDDYTFHIVPMLNPEGYIVSTSAIRTLIPREMSLEEAEKICKEYYLAFKSDDQEALERKKSGLAPDRTTLKHHQRMFQDVDYTCISPKYSNLRNHIKEIFEKYPDLPKGCIATWSANGDGIDIQANSTYNSSIGKIENNEHIFMGMRYCNIDYSHPGPINCPMDKEYGFEEAIETRAIRDLLEKLHRKGTLVGYENFHSTGGLIYQRPCKEGNGISISEDLYWEKIVNNIFKAMSYRESTYKNANDKQNSKYRIMKSQDKASSTNDVFRMKYPADLLIELSGMGANPIGPYGDVNGNYKNTIFSNIAAFSDFIRYYDTIEKLSKGAYNSFRYMEKQYKLETDEDLKEEHIKAVYEIAEIMMREAIQDIKDGKVKELEDKLTRGYFAEEWPGTELEDEK